MTREEFAALPAGMALGMVWDALRLEDVLGRLEAPKPPRSPKYDMRVYRKGGFQWASELPLASLQFWHQRATESAAGGGQYAEKDAKKAASLERWISWRSVAPAEPWTGERDDRRVTARAPSRDAETHESPPRGAPRGTSGGEFDTPPDDDSIPF